MVMRGALPFFSFFPLPSFFLSSPFTDINMGILSWEKKKKQKTKKRPTWDEQSVGGEFGSFPIRAETVVRWQQLRSQYVCLGAEHKQLCLSNQETPEIYFLSVCQAPFLALWTRGGHTDFISYFLAKIKQNCVFLFHIFKHTKCGNICIKRTIIMWGWLSGFPMRLQPHEPKSETKKWTRMLHANYIF